MRLIYLPLVAVTISSAATSAEGQPAYASPLRYSNYPHNLFKRQGCPGGLSNCGAFGNTGACCPTDQTCAEDENGNVACCPIGAACTGTIGEATNAEVGAENTDAVLLGDPSASSPTPPPNAPTSSGFRFPSPTNDDNPSPPQSTVANAPFPFAIVPTTFENAAECSSYATSCSQQYESCVETLGAGVNGVTVAGGGAGITVNNQPSPVAGARSICTSLSSEACFGLQTDLCPQYGTSFVAGAVPRVTACPRLIYAAGAGAIAGAAGAVI